MGVTISRAAERKPQPPPRGSRGRIPGFDIDRRGGGRDREAALLALSGAVVLCCILYTWLAVSRPLADTEGRLERGEVVNLNAVSRSGDLLPLLAFLDTPQERSFVADHIRERVSAGTLDNVGEIGHIRVQASEIDPPRMPGLSARIRASGRGSATLLSAAQLRQLKPRLLVRTPAQFRKTTLLGAALLFAGFLLAHLVLRFRRFRGDLLLLPLLLLLSGLGFALMMSLRDPLRDLPLHLRFALGVLAGCALFLAGALIDLERTPLPRRGVWALGLAAVLSGLLIVFGAGPGGSDAKVNFLGFQPVELIKILIALFLAGYFADRWELLREVPERRLPLGKASRVLTLPRLEYALPPLVAIGTVLFFFFLQKDLGPALVLAGLFLILFSVARGRPGMAPYATADGRYVFLGIFSEDHFWDALCRAFDLPDYVGLNMADRAARADELTPALAARFAARDRDAVLAELGALGVPIAPILSREEALAEPHFTVRGVIARGPDGDRRVAHPIRYRNHPARAPGRPPQVGEGGEGGFAD